MKITAAFLLARIERRQARAGFGTAAV